MDPSQCASRKRDRTNENFAKATKNLMWRCEKIRQCYGADVYIQVHRKHKHFEYSTSDEPSWPKSKPELARTYPIPEYDETLRFHYCARLSMANRHSTSNESTLNMAIIHRNEA
ncbi:hypothetical protein CGGC5_v011012 [Colletotrichum fructicola Nara gc5]|uniref:Uncharacterized protein n=1 Tax=Colletotrichum fructicola (strain Nara gc5) TaxID=1213859 RepID=A0A7J6IW53_COLFN|nr:hypothetical protein CFRS1_v015356 [Colletotrichum fructicola]KAF4481127.1 hypothetical protein CGGC5_v011012 [Colletotrichum fructicola Nara gc5]